MIDFGTATTFDAVSAKGEYLGGVICPGPQISADALVQRTAKLPRIDVRKPPRVIGTNTIGAMQSGLFWGYVDMVEGLVRRMKAELGGAAVVVATGGLASIVAPESKTGRARRSGADAARPSPVVGTPAVIDVESYARDLEAYLCRKNDGHLIRITGPAFEQVQGWAAQGVPLKVAQAGIDRYFERYYRKGPRRRPVRIEFCEADVLDAFDDWRRAVGVTQRRRRFGRRARCRGARSRRRGRASRWRRRSRARWRD